MTDIEVEAAIAARVRALRAACGLTLQALSSRSGVSRAMLSRIERGESSPTAGLLVRLCDGLGVTVASIVGGAVPSAGGSLVRRSDQPTWRDPGSGYTRRAVLPSASGACVEIAEVELPAGTAMVLDALDGLNRGRHVWVLDGALQVTLGGDVFALERGDRLELRADGPAGFHNPGTATARYAVVTERAGEGGRPG